jgi:hypothetical protein
MDPDVTLQNVREAVREVRAWIDGEADGDPFVAVVSKLHDAVDALDVWLTRGGHLPAPWAVERDI